MVAEAASQEKTQHKDFMYYALAEKLPERLAKFLGHECFFSAVGDSLKAYTLMHPEAKKVGYPFFYIKPTSFALDRNGYPPKKLAMQARAGRIDENDNLVKMIAFIPLKVTMTSVFITDDFSTLTKFVAKWYSTWLLGSINTTLGYHGVRVDLSVEFGEELTVPEKTQSPDDPRELKFESTLTVNLKIDDRDRHKMVEIIKGVSFSLSTPSGKIE